MTRINLVDPSQLTDKHLLAEYKEITRPFNKVIKRIENGTMGDVVIPETYCLGTGHETFFFNKLMFLMLRYYRLRDELIHRGVNIDMQKFLLIRRGLFNSLSDTPYWNDYNPTPEEIYLNMARLCVKSKIDSVKDELERESNKEPISVVFYDIEMMG